MRTLKVKCPTWQHVETFYERKLRPDKTLTIRVPFETEDNAPVMLGLQLPDGTVMAIEGRVRGKPESQPGQKSAIQLHLSGLTDEVLERLKDLVAEAHGLDPAARRDSSATVGAESRLGGVSATFPGAPEPAETASRLPPVPVPVPEDAPISEVVEVPEAPSSLGVRADEREVYARLETELGNLHECAAHEVLGVASDAGVEDIRRAYFACTKRYHPDLFARYGSPAILHRAQEVFIHINRAYDRMRASLVAAGRAVVAGPALLAHDGWLAGLDDILSPVPGARGSNPAPNRAGVASGSARPGRPGRARSGGVQPVSAGAADRMGPIRGVVDDFMARGDFEGARSHVADALHADPRNRQLRALYYVVSGKQALFDGEEVLAATQFEAALAHDRECREARDALDQLRSSGKHRAFPRFLQ